jgi:anti-sigma factor RsiW
VSEPRCPTIELSAYSDGALDAPRASAIDAHVAGCSSCRERLREERTLKRAVLVLACPGADVLGRFIDGALPPVAIERVQAHVEKCFPCTDVLAWTREAALLLDSGEIEREAPALPRRRRSGRHAAIPMRRKPGKLISLVLPIAAAAAVLLCVLLLMQEPSKPDSQGVATNEPAPPPSPRKPLTTPPAVPPVSPKKPAPGSETPGPDTETPPGEQPVEPVPPRRPETPPGETPRPGETPATEKPPVTPGETERPGEPKPLVPTATTVALSSVGGDLRLGASRDKAVKVQGAVPVGPRDILCSMSGAGRLHVGDADVLLAPASDARFAWVSATPRLTLDKGEAYSESEANGLELACHGAVVRSDAAGAKLLLRAAPRGSQLFVCEGKATFSSAAGEVALGAGESSEVEGDAAPTKPRTQDVRTTPWLVDARGERSLAVGLEYPRCYLAKDSVLACRALLERKDAPLVDRARALYAVEATRAADERLARVGELAGAAADAAFDGIVRDAASDSLAAPAASLALLARARRLPATAKDLPKALLALGKTLEKASADQLAKDTDALLAARALERSGIKLRALREKVLATIDPEDPGSLGRATLAGAALDPRAVEDGLKKLDQALNVDCCKPELRLLPAALLGADRSAAFAGEAKDDDRRFGRLLAHLAAGGPRACAGPSASTTLVLITRDSSVLAGRAPAAPQSPSVVIQAREGRGPVEITFAFESARHPKVVVLEGSWDKWAEREPMTRRRDGSFFETLALPRARYEYKLRIEGGRIWETDPRNPLSQGDNHGGLNSVIVLD